MLKNLAYVWPYLRPHRRKLILGVLAIVASVLMSMTGPLLLGWSIDAIRRGAPQAELLRYAGMLLGFTVATGIFSYTQRMILVKMSREIEFDMRNDFFEHLEKQPPAFFIEHPTGDLMARATNDMGAVRMLCGPAIMYATNTVVTALFAMIFIVRINFSLSMLALFTMPLVAISTKYFGGRIHDLFTGVQEKYANVTTKVQESLSGVRVVRAYAQEAREEAEFRRVTQEHLDASMRLVGWSAAFGPLLQSLVGLGFVAVLWYGGLLVIRYQITIGQFVSFQLFLGRLVFPMIAAGFLVNMAQRGTASMIRLRKILDVQPAIRDEGPLTDPREIQGTVQVRNLTFAYGPGLDPALANIDLQVQAGQTVAIVGRTGSGKSTLLSLIPRLLDPPEGSLFVDGVDVRRMPLARLRSAISTVPQETFLFSDTIRANIALGRARATEEEIREAARMAGLEPDLAAFPEGLDTIVGERGLTLSGGQKQRVALARALLRDSRILLLDDCLSAVDTHTEEEILRNLRTLFKGRTVFLVSHRISTVKDANVIVVLEHGRIAERGTHAQLITSGGLYADLYQRQLLEEELEAV
ncbi:MAG TPA: ABC transporter ATP-binding protein [Thermoanaerobaculia bacterium]